MTALKISAGILLGAIAGYAYYYYIGCSSGSCPLTSNWMVTTGYGALSGLILTIPGRKKKTEKAEEDD